MKSAARLAIGRAAPRGKRGICAWARYDGPRPTKVGQAPQLSTTDRGTVIACPAVAGRTVKVVCCVPAGSGTENAPATPTWVPASTRVFVPAPKLSAWSVLAWLGEELRALTVTWRLPLAPGTVAIKT